MNIKVADLKKFQKLSANIKSAGVLPILDYIKFGGGTITKTALSSFIVYDCGEATDSVLVDEKQLYSLLNITHSEFINIKVIRDKTFISDSLDTLHFQTQKVIEYPAIPEPETDKSEISKDFLSAMGQASFFSDNMGPIPKMYDYVMIGENAICSGDGFIGFHHPVAEDIRAVIEKKISASLSKLPIKAFSKGESYYFFFMGDAIMGFSIQQIGFADWRKFMQGGDKITFSASSSDLMSFNSLSIQNSENPMVSMTTGRIEMTDILFNKGNDRPMENLTPNGEFTYDPARMNRVLTAIECEELDFYDGKGMYYIKSSDTKATAIIAKINKA
jgi:hypothetical protein